MKKTILIAVGAILLIGLLGVNISLNPKQLQIREQIFNTEKISKNTSDLVVGWFSDLCCADETDRYMVYSLVSKINNVNPDVVVFSGDLLNSDSISEEDKTILIEQLSSINPSCGKYAVLGDRDVNNGQPKHNVNEILESSGFEIIENSNKVVSLSRDSKLNIVGLGNCVNGTSNPDVAFSGINTENCTIVVTHCPDSFDDMEDYTFDLMFSGHSLGGKVRIPFISYFLTEAGAKSYYHGTIAHNEKKLDIANGVGTPGRKMRFLADPEVVFYSLRSK